MTMIDHVIDVDGHVFETPEMWEEYLEEEFQPLLKFTRKE